MLVILVVVVFVERGIELDLIVWNILNWYSLVLNFNCINNIVGIFLRDLINFEKLNLINFLGLIIFC